MMNARMQGFGTSIFSEMTLLANKHKAVNLGQGFPNFDPRGKVGKQLLESAARAIVSEGRNQYSRSFGALELTRAIQHRFAKIQNGTLYDHENEITVFSGATEALYCTFASLLEVGDEVIVFEPHYDSYRPCIVAAGGRERIVTLRADNSQPNRFTFNRNELKQAFGPRTKSILLNSPHNPTGTVFDQSELEFISELCREHNVIAVSDEVYDSIIFDGRQHISIASLPGMIDKTVTISSAGKTFSVTGWKIGWALASQQLSQALRTSHQFVTFCSATPFQYAVAEALQTDAAFYEDLIDDYQKKRDKLFVGLKQAGFHVMKPEGTYFIQADVSNMLKALKMTSDVEFCRWLTEKAGVCAIPSSAFYSKENVVNFVRFAFCKTDDVLEEGIHRLKTRMEL